MVSKVESRVLTTLERLVAGTVLCVAAMVGLYIALVGGVSVLPIEAGDLFLLATLVAQLVWGVAIVRPGAQAIPLLRLGRGAEVLFFAGLALFLFAFIFASNANMDYVQRFVAAGGNVQLAPDTTQERWIAVRRYSPSLAAAIVLYGMAFFRGLGRDGGILLVLASIALSVVSYPSFVATEGIGAVGWVMLVPLFVALRRATAARHVWYLLLYGLFFTLLGNYWLGTFSLVSLQTVGIIFFVYYLLFGVVTALLRGYVGKWSWLFYPAVWTLFEFARSSGFLGYPWLLTGHTQYRFLPAIQYASLGGVWLVSFLVILVNAAIAESLVLRTRRKVIVAVITAAAIVLVGLAQMNPRLDAHGNARVALIQQNSDPRKHEYERTLESLQRLTNETLPEKPDLVVWSETAFVPNIRRWSQEDPERRRLARLVHEFLEYQRSIGTWLVTGNDDYRRVLDDTGRETERLNYNAAVLFDPQGRRIDTYHKIKLVPFTEHFPYEEQLPWVYSLLQDFDVAFWEPGEERVVFRHPKFAFATPICFEDVFPGEVRKFALAGAQVIVNISNDYWSLTEVAATQHFAGGLFRAVELRMPLVRATASGVTAYVDPVGRVIGAVPQYSEEFIVVDVAVETGDTLYRRWGDWFPLFCAVLLVALLAGNVYGGRREE